MHQPQTHDTGHRCSPSRPCHRWRKCSYCARQRQRKIADAVEKLEQQSGKLRWHILYPSETGEKGLLKAKSNWLRTTRPDGAIWTVEQSRQTGALHANIITPDKFDRPFTAGQHWHQRIKGNVRDVGAYIAKPQQMPRSTDYKGNLYGCAGPLWQILCEQRQSAVVAAAAIQYAINSHAMIDQADTLYQFNKQREIKRREQLLNLAAGDSAAGQITSNKAFLNAQESARAQLEKENLMPTHNAGLTKSDFRNIAARWLPDLLEWKEQHRQKSSLEIMRDFMQREGSI